MYDAAKTKLKYGRLLGKKRDFFLTKFIFDRFCHLINVY